MLEQVVLLAGAIAAALAEWLVRPAGDRRILLAAFAGAWLAMGLQAIVRGRLALGGRRGPATVWQGSTARWLGAVMSVVAAGFYFATRLLP